MTSRRNVPARLVVVVLGLAVAAAVVLGVRAGVMRGDGAGQGSPGVSPGAPGSGSVGPRPGRTPDDVLGTPTPPPEESAGPSSEPTCLDVPRLTPITVLTFNIHGGVGPTGADLAGIAEEIGAARADVVLLQEVDRFRARTAYVDTPAWLAAELGMHHSFGATVVRPAAARGRGREEYGLATLSRHRVVETEHLALPRPPGTEQRAVLRTRIDLGGGQLLDVHNTHLEHSSSEARTRQALALRDLLAADPTPDLLGGDLNALEGGPAHSLLTDRLHDVWPVVGEGPGYTVPPRDPRRRIDYVLHDDSMVALGAEVVGSRVSDHHGVRAELMVTGDPRCRRLDVTRR